MTQFEGDLSPPFEIVEPSDWRAPIIFNSPHSGSVYPVDFLNASRIDLAALRRSEDSFMDELIADLSDRGFPTVRVNFPRSYVDVNREPYELDPRMFNGRLPSFANTRSMRVAGGLGTIPRVVGDGQEIYRERLNVDEALGRIEALYKPYHRALRRWRLDGRRGRSAPGRSAPGYWAWRAPRVRCPASRQWCPSGCRRLRSGARRTGYGHGFVRPLP